MKIRKIKKAMKNSNGFFSIKIKNEDYIFCSQESYKYTYNKKGFCACEFNNPFVYIPYKLISKIYFK